MLSLRYIPFYCCKCPLCFCLFTFLYLISPYSPPPVFHFLKTSLFFITISFLISSCHCSISLLFFLPPSVELSISSVTEAITPFTFSPSFLYSLTCTPLLATCFIGQLCTFSHFSPFRFKTFILLFLRALVS